MKATIVLALIGVLVLAACTQAPTGNVTKTQETIKIGFLGPLTGDVASLGQASKDATQLAVEEINAAGGVNGKKLQLILEDGKCNGKDATNAANKLVNIDNVDFIIGGLCSSETLAAAPIAEAAGTIMISPCSSNPDITTAGDYIFRVYPSDLYQGNFAAEYAYNELGARKVAVMACQSDWCVGLRDVFSERFEELGGTVVETVDFPQLATDLRSELSRVKAVNPDLIYFASYTEAAVNAFKQAKELGIPANKFIGGDSWDDNTIWQETKGVSDGARFVLVDVNAPEAFKQKFTQRFGKELTLCAPQGYDAAYILKQAITQAGTDPTAVKDALYGISYQGVSGPLAFDRNGDVQEASYAIKEVHNGEAIELTE